MGRTRLKMHGWICVWIRGGGGVGGGGGTSDQCFDWAGKHAGT